MSRLGKLIVKVPETVEAVLNGTVFVAKGPKGQVIVQIPEDSSVIVANREITVAAKESNMHGLVRAMVANAVTGVSDGWSKNLDLSGTGYRAVVNGNNLQLSVGFSHQVNVSAPEGIEFVVKENKISVRGADKGLVGQVAASIRRVRPVDPYKAKGFKYENEIVIKKAGKAAKAGGAAK